MVSVLPHQQVAILFIWSPSVYEVRHNFQLNYGLQFSYKAPTLFSTSCCACWLTSFWILHQIFTPQSVAPKFTYFTVFSEFIHVPFMGLSNMSRLLKCLPEFSTKKKIIKRTYFIATHFANGAFLLSLFYEMGN